MPPKKEPNRRRTQLDPPRSFHESLARLALEVGPKRFGKAVDKLVAELIKPELTPEDIAYMRARGDFTEFLAEWDAKNPSQENQQPHSPRSPEIGL